MRWGTPNDSAEGINFDETFAKEGFNAPRFLKLDNVVGQVKRQNDKVTDKLVANPNILLDLVSICLKPKSYSHQDLPLITNEHTYNAIQILSNLTQQFSDFLFSSSNPAEIPNEDDYVVTDDPPCEDAPLNPVFIHLMSLLQEEKPIDETALSYLVKIVTSLCYQKPKQMIIALSHGENICRQIFQHFYSRSVYEWLTRLLQIEDSISFFQKQKLMLFKMCVSAIDSEQNEDLLLEKLENYQSIFTVLLQKIDDRFDKAKFSSMVKQLLTEQNCLVFLFRKMFDYPENSQILEKVLSILDIYLRFSSNHRLINASKNSDNLENSIYEIRLNNDSIKEIKKIVKAKQAEILNLNLKKSLTRKYLQLTRALIIFDSDFITEIITNKFVSDLLHIFISSPTNNILHNLVRDILIESINKSYQHISPILLSKDNQIFIQMTRKSMWYNSGKKQLYSNQIYLIFQTLSKKGQQNLQLYQKLIKGIQNYEQIVYNMKEKDKFYSKLIGGNARKQSSCWGDSSADIVFDKIFPTNGNSDKKIDLVLNQKDTADFIEGNENQHWFDCGGLPLDSDSSRDDVSGNDIENCLSPRSLKGLQSSSQNQNEPQILVNSDQHDFPLARQNSDIKIDLSQLQINSNVKIEIEDCHQNVPPNISQFEADQEMQELGGTSFNKFFSAYQSFQLEEVLSQIQ